MKNKTFDQIREKYSGLKYRRQDFNSLDIYYGDAGITSASVPETLYPVAITLVFLQNKIGGYFKRFENLTPKVTHEHPWGKCSEAEYTFGVAEYVSAVTEFQIVRTFFWDSVRKAIPVPENKKARLVLDSDGDLLIAWRHR